MAAGGQSPAHAALSLDELVALGEELAALTRAGVPLESGLASLAPSDAPRGWERRSGILRERLERGESLEQAVADPAVGFGPLGQRVIRAGLRANRLAPAIEGLIRSARLRAELRQLSALALLYPTALLLVAYGVLLLMVLVATPQFVDSYFEIGIEPPGWLVALERLGRLPAWGWWIFPALVVGLAVGWWIETNRGRMLGPGWSRHLLGIVPGVRSLLRDAETAAFADLTALLLESGVVLDEALHLAGGASGNLRMAAAAEQVAAAVQRGEPLAAAAGGVGFPPLVRWLMTAGQARGALSVALREAAVYYSDLSRRRADWLESTLPMLAALVVGGTAVVVCALFLFVPWVTLLRRIAEGAIL